MLGLGIDDLEAARECQAEAAGNDRQTSVDLIAIRQIEGRLRNIPLQDALEADIQVESFKCMNALLQSLGDGKIAQLHPDSVVGLGCVLGYQQQIGHFVVDEVVVAPEVFLVDVQTRRSAKE